MRIPKRFKLLGQTIEVKYDATLLSEKDWHGSASYRRNEISLQPDCQATPLKPDQIEHNFFHELTHHITYYAGETISLKDDAYLHKQEGFIDVFAGLLHQALTTMEYEEDTCRNQ